MKFNFKIQQYQTDAVDAVVKVFRGLNLDKVWDNIIVDIGGVNIADGNTLDEQLALDERRQKIQKEIDRLEEQARKETQPRKKFELVQQMKQLKNELEGLGCQLTNIKEL